MFEFLLTLGETGIYTTFVIRKPFWTQMSNGERQLKKKFQIAVARELYELYHEEFFLLVNRLVELPVNDNAKSIFDEWKQELDLYFLLIPVIDTAAVSV